MFSELVAHLENWSFTEGYFPHGFNRAQATPLLKRDGLDKNIPANYRPISNLNSISKIIERLALVRLRQHLDLVGSPSFNSAQFAYRRRHFDRNGATPDDWFRSSNPRPRRSNDVDSVRHISGVRHGCALNPSTPPKLQFWNWRRCAQMNQVVSVGALTVRSNRHSFVETDSMWLRSSSRIDPHFHRLYIAGGESWRCITELYSNNVPMTRNYTLLCLRCHQRMLSYNFKTVSLLYANGLPKMDLR